MKKFLFVTLLIITAMAGCTAEEATPEAPTAAATAEVPDATVPAVTPVVTVVSDPEIVLTPALLPATIDSVELAVERSEIIVLVNGSLADGCTSIAQIDQSINSETGTLSVMVLTERDSEAVCTQAIVPFEEIVRFDRTDLSSGSYTVDVNGITESFAIVSENASLAVTIADEEAVVTGSDFPPNREVGLAVAVPNSGYVPSTMVETEDDGSFETAVSLEGLDADQTYLIVANLDGQEILSDEFTLDSDAAPEVSGANLYFVLLEDAGESGEEIGCGDSVVPVEISFPPTAAPLTAAFEALLAVNGQYYEGDLYHALYNADLELTGARVVEGVATVELEGDFAMGGVCDAPRIEAQLRQTAAQFDTVETVEILINGEPLESLLDESG